MNLKIDNCCPGNFVQNLCPKHNSGRSEKKWAPQKAGAASLNTHEAEILRVEKAIAIDDQTHPINSVEKNYQLVNILFTKSKFKFRFFSTKSELRHPALNRL